MLSSSEFIRGYTEMIICSILIKQDSYIYEMVSIIKKKSNNKILVSNPSLLIIIKKMLKEEKVSCYNILNEKGINRKYYKLTKYGIEEYNKYLGEYLESLDSISNFLKGDFYI